MAAAKVPTVPLGHHSAGQQKDRRHERYVDHGAESGHPGMPNSNVVIANSRNPNPQESMTAPPYIQMDIWQGCLRDPRVSEQRRLVASGEYRPEEDAGDQSLRMELRWRQHYIRKPAGPERFPCCSDSEWSVQTTTSTVARQASAIIVRNERPVAGRLCLLGARRGWAPRSSTRLNRRRISVCPCGLWPPPRRIVPTSALGRSPRRQLTHASDERLGLFSALVASTAWRDFGNRWTRLRSTARSSLQKDI